MSMVISGKLTDEQLLAVELLFSKPVTGDSFEEIAEKCGISSRTLFRWRTGNKHFIEEYNKMTVDKTRNIIPDATHLLADIIANPSKYREATVIKGLEIAFKANSMLGMERHELLLTHSTTPQKEAQDVSELLKSYGID